MSKLKEIKTTEGLFNSQVIREIKKRHFPGEDEVIYFDKITAEELYKIVVFVLFGTEIENE